MAFVYKENLIPKSKYNIKCPYEMQPEVIVVHNTSNDASAENEAKYMTNNNQSTSFHYVVDDKVVIKLIPEWRNAFHAGDGATGPGNRKGLSIEICYSKSGGQKFIEAEKNAAQFIADLLKLYNWDISKVKKHQDYANKYCPHRTLDMGWDRFLKMIESHLDPKPQTSNSYYRIKKEWNEGKWSSDQKGAYISYEIALNNFKDGYLDEGYKIFSPEGQILYPSQIAHSLASQMVKDGVTNDLEYWSNVFNQKEDINLEYIKTIIERYSNLINKTKKEEEKDFFLVNGVYIFPIDINNFKIKYFDKPKTSGTEKTYFNLGYFGNFIEGNKKFTLPSGNLVADINESEISEDILKYLKQRKIANGKLYFSANQNSSAQFRNKQVSTLIVENGGVRIEKINQVSESFDYAVSGVPVIAAGQKVTNYTNEGWESSVARPTYHGFIGIKNNKIYYFPMLTTKNNCITSGEVYDKIKDFGFSDVIKLDGGGSAFFKRNNEVQVNTKENRQINNIGVIE